MCHNDEREMDEQEEVGQRQFYFLAVRCENPRSKSNKN